MPLVLRKTMSVRKRQRTHWFLKNFQKKRMRTPSVNGPTPRYRTKRPNTQLTIAESSSKKNQWRHTDTSTKGSKITITVSRALPCDCRPLRSTTNKWFYAKRILVATNGEWIIKHRQYLFHVCTKLQLPKLKWSALFSLEATARINGNRHNQAVFPALRNMTSTSSYWQIDKISLLERCRPAN